MSHVFSRLCLLSVGPGSDASVAVTGPEAAAAAGAEGSRTLRLRLESTAAQRTRGCQNLPCAGTRHISLPVCPCCRFSIDEFIWL